MIWLGIDTNSKLIYEGGNMYGATVVWPSPVATPASFGLSTDSELKAAKFESWGISKFLFREDSFDFVTRIRRGRFYKAEDSQPNCHDWAIIIASPVQAYPSEKIENRPDLAKKDAYTFQSYAISMELAKAEGKQLLVMLGAGKAATPWAVVNIETIHTEEELVTLKARQSMGALPVVDWDKVPDTSCAKVREELARLENEFRKAGPESVIDRAREAATAILSAWLQASGNPKANGKDLGDLVKIFAESQGTHQGRIIACTAEIPQRLHSRGKHAEREKRDTLRPIREQDAELAVQCIGTILCDLGWAEWQ